MFKRKKGFTTSQSRLTSQRMRSAVVGSHVPRRIRSGSKHMNADTVGFANSRKNKRASRGIVDTILPSSSSRESSSEHSRRVSRREFTQEVQHKVRTRRILALAAAALVVISVACGVGIATFLGSLDAKMGLKNSDAKSILAMPAQNTPWYALLSADLDSASASTKVEGPEALILARVDEAAQSVSLISIPVNYQITLKDGKPHQLREAAAQGDAALISAVAGIADVGISHYAKTDASGIAMLVDALGGVTVEVLQEVDDPAAGDVFISKGTQTLDGQTALTYLRAQNFKNGVKDQAANQSAFFATLAVRMMDSANTFSFATMLDSVGGSFQTDLGAIGSTELADKLRGIEASSVQQAMLPGYETTRDNVVYYIASSDSWTAMIKRMKAGESLVEQGAIAGQIDRGSFTVEVRNGAAITGGAGQMAEILKADGFNVTEVTNADVAVFSETLVVYDGAERRAMADEVIAALGAGRAVLSAGYYEYGTDVLVILGKDWKPLT